MSDDTDSVVGEQTSIDPYREMNRYEGRDGKHRSAAVFEPPRRTIADGWAKFHAARDCGSQKVVYVEMQRHRPSSSRYEYDLCCWKCGHRIPEDEVLFIGGEWWSQYGWRTYGQTIDNLRLQPERVLALGPDPAQEELIEALNLTRIEGNASVLGLCFANETYNECVDCERETFLRFDRRCRMCYDGEWTDRMQSTVETAGVQVRERNNSFAHRLEDHVNPLSTGGRAFEGKILWRRHSEERVPKLVEVTQCLKDDSDGHWEYILADFKHTREWRYRQEDLAACFWDTGLYNDEQPKPIMDEQLREIHDRVTQHYDSGEGND